MEEPIPGEAQASVTISQKFLLFCCSSEQYSVTLPGKVLSSTGHIVRYTYPDESTEDVEADHIGDNMLYIKKPPGYDHPCTVQVEVFATGGDNSIAVFPLDLVSPVEYLYRKLSLDDSEVTDRVTETYSSALLAMSLSYYYIMGEHLRKDDGERMDEILSSLLTMYGSKAYSNPRRSSATNERHSIARFAQHHHLQRTLRYLSMGGVVGELPAQLPKVEHGRSQSDAELYTSLSREISDQSEYAKLVVNHTPATDETTYEEPMTDSVSMISKKIPADYLQPRQNPKPHNKAGKSPPVVTPFSANKRIQRSRSAEDMLDDNEYTYIVPREYASKTLNRPTRGQPPLRPPPPDPAKLVSKSPPGPQKPIAPVRGKPKSSSSDERPNSPKLNGTSKVMEKSVSPTRLSKQPEFPSPLKSPLAKNISLPAHPPIPRAKPRTKPRS
ncbi:uncharacterized protein [Dysidea avara]|uniref:uncharacterized protein isoform X2 n=1 Tax=Dysidea avara TaxID=196820 RepID=UPI00331AA507